MSYRQVGCKKMSFDWKQFAEGWLNYTKAVVSPDSLPPEAKEKAEHRSKICKACPEFHSLTQGDSKGPIKGLCKKCGCAFPAMVYSIGKDCPLNKW